MIVTHLSRHALATYQPVNQAVLVSITNPSSVRASVPPSLYSAVLRLAFWDRAGCFTSRDAATIWAFVLGAQASGVAEVVVQCEKGRSRSAGIAAALPMAGIEWPGGAMVEVRRQASMDVYGRMWRVREGALKRYQKARESGQV